ncbi:MAG: histidine phosphatase family protein, partial [Lachnospiraceae bacterium]|nr:histidine phosphatase family protein [Lachnospiraceae bacterium]
MDIYLIRHGETDYNKGRRLQGVTDIPLNERGIALAEQTARELLEIRFDKIFTSPLVRAKKTAEIIRGERKIPIIVTDGLREISFG